MSFLKTQLGVIKLVSTPFLGISVRNIHRLACKKSVKFSARTMGSQSQGPKMILSKEKAMVDERINVEVFGLKAFQEVTLVAGLSHSDAVYVSHGHFKANSDGYISLLHTPSTGGTYTGTDSMGLFWSMVPARNTKRGARLFNRDITKPFEVNIAAVDGYNSFLDQMAADQQSVLCSAVAQRWYRSKDVTQQPIREGRVRGTLFMPKGEGPFPGVVDLFGTGGGLYEYRAALLASKGFATLALAYFNYDDLPKDIALDYVYFDEATSVLLSQPKVIQDGIGVLGSSKGAEIALHMASVNKNIKACVALNGSAQYYFGEITYRGKPIKESHPDMGEMQVVDGDILVFDDCYNEVGEGDYIPLENAEQCEFLLVEGQDDRLTGTCHTPRMIDRLKKHGRSNYTYLSYPGAGHVIEAPYLPLNRFQYHRLGGFILYGGTPLAHALAQEHSWPYIINFFTKHLQSAGKVSQPENSDHTSKL